MNHLKSSKENLIKRGFAEKEDIAFFEKKEVTQLLKLVDSSNALERTVAIRILCSKGLFNDMALVQRLLEKLLEEKALYTKLEICHFLGHGNHEVAGIMGNYLGKIRKNQHTHIPDRVSLKKSFPLPRDIIARSMGRMNQSVFPDLLSQLETRETVEIRELLDGIGYMVFNNPELATSTHFSKLQDTFDRELKDEIIVWKMVMCCSVFPITESIRLLEKIQQTFKNATILLECKRSLKLISAHLKSSESLP